MAWVPLIHHTSWEHAHEVAAQFELSCVAIRQHSWLLDREVKPIIRRVAIKQHWYNYYEDGSYSKTRLVHTGKEPPSYAPCLFVPDKISYDDFLLFCRKHLLALKGKYNSFILYTTAASGEVVYSTKYAKLQIDIDLPFNSDMLYFEKATAWHSKNSHNKPVHRPRKKPIEVTHQSPAVVQIIEEDGD